MNYSLHFLGFSKIIVFKIGLDALHNMPTAKRYKYKTVNSYFQFFVTFFQKKYVYG